MAVPASSEVLEVGSNVACRELTAADGIVTSHSSDLPIECSFSLKVRTRGSVALFAFGNSPNLRYATVGCSGGASSSSSISQSSSKSCDTNGRRKGSS